MFEYPDCIQTTVHHGLGILQPRLDHDGGSFQFRVSHASYADELMHGRPWIDMFGFIEMDPKGTRSYIY